MYELCFWFVGTIKKIVALVSDRNFKNKNKNNEKINFHFLKISCGKVNTPHPTPHLLHNRFFFLCVEVEAVVSFEINMLRFLIIIATQQMGSLVEVI